MPVRWYASLFLIVLVGITLIVYSRYERQHPSASTPPAIGTHWYAALAFDLCGTPEPNLPSNPNEATKAPGLHTIGDGVIQVSPATAADAGDKATLGRFVATYPGLVLTLDSVRYPGSPKTLHNGDKCPAGTPDAGKVGTLRVKVWPNFAPPGVNNPTVPSDPTTLKLANGQLITVFFGPSSASIGKPSQQVIATLLQDQSSTTTTTTTSTVPALTTTTTSPTTTTTTTARPTTTTTTTSTTTTTTTTAPTTTTTSSTP